MKGTFFLGNGEFETRDIKLDHPKENEVLIDVAACGVCGTDVHIYHGDQGSAPVNPPVILGHELAGVVKEIGAGVTTVKVGDHVTVDPNSYCGKCHYCKINKKQLCENLYAVGVNRDGGFAEECIVPETQCFVLNKDIPLEWGAMTEPLACCLHGIDIANIRRGDTVYVIGAGAIGLIMLQLAKLSGASKVIVSSIGDKGLAAAKQLGADAVIDPSKEDPKLRVKEELGQEGADVIIECVGNVHATEQAFSVTKRGSTVLLFSVPKVGATYNLSLEDVYKKELKIYGSFINPDTQGRAVELINGGKINFEPIITHRYPIEKLKDAILMQMNEESIKVIVGKTYE